MKRQKLTSAEDIKTYSEKPSIKKIACEEANKKGYKCIIENSVLMFLYDQYDENKYEEIQDWLKTRFGREEVVDNPFKAVDKKETKNFKHVIRIPFSIGFKKDIRSLTAQADEVYVTDPSVQEEL